MDVSFFFGLSSYYRRFVKSFAGLANPLNQLLDTQQKKDRNPKVEWNQECQESFDKIKAALTTAAVLGFADFQKSCMLVVDACFRRPGTGVSAHWHLHQMDSSRPSTRSDDKDCGESPFNWVNLEVWSSSTVTLRPRSLVWAWCHQRALRPLLHT